VVQEEHLYDESTLNKYLLWYEDNDKISIHVRNTILKKLNDLILRSVTRLIIASIPYLPRHRRN
jgi:hypothetical protein